MSESQRSAKSRIPEFKSIEEEADFWDTHDMTEFQDEFRPTKIQFARDLSHAIIIDLDPKDIDKLWEIARSKDANPVLLAKTWILEHLNSSDPSPRD